MIDVMDEAGAYMELIRNNLEYEYHMKYDRHVDKEMYEEIYETVCDVVCVRRRTIRINGEDYPYELVKSRFLKLDSSHVEYVMGCMRETATKITNIRSYLITALYNAPSTMSHYYQQEVQHDNVRRGMGRKRILHHPQKLNFWTDGPEVDRRHHGINKGCKAADRQGDKEGKRTSGV